MMYAVNHETKQVVVASWGHPIYSNPEYDEWEQYKCRPGDWMGEYGVQLCDKYIADGYEIAYIN